MAQYPIPNPQFGIYNNNNFSKQPSATDALTLETGKLYFLQFPNAQTTQTEFLNDIGVGGTAAFEGPVSFNDTVTYNSDIEFLTNVIVDGNATVGGNLLCETSATVTGILTSEGGIDISLIGTGITFPDNTVQTTAYNDTNAVQNDQANTFQAGFTQTFSGPVNLNGITNAVTQLTGNNTSLIATTAFVQDAVQVSGVQVTDSPLLWSGANTNQYNVSSGTNLTYSYPFGLSQLYNLSGGNGEFSLVSNTGSSGAQTNAFSIYCIQGNQTGTQLRSLQPQLTISNNNTAMFVRDGINVNNKNILNVNNLSCSTGQTIGIVDGVTNIMTFNTSGINSYENITMNTGNIIMNTNNISGIGTLSGTGLGDILITSGLNFSTGSGINCGGGSISNCNAITDITGNLVTTTTPLNNSITTAIATTGYVQTAISGGVAGAAILNPQPTVTQTFTGEISFSKNPSSTDTVPIWGTNSSTLASTNFVQNALPRYSNGLTISTYGLSPGNATLVSPSYPQQTELISVNTQYSTVSFFDNPFSYNCVNVTNIPIGEAYVFTNPILILAFSAIPWSTFPPSSVTDTMIGTTNTGLNVGIPIGWQSIAGSYLLYIGNSYNISNGSQITTSLASLGLFSA